jgi:hypothetical protein
MRGRAVWFWALFSLLALCPATHAHDSSGFWQREHDAGRAPDAQWWNGLASGKGLCCSFADGERVEDVDWTIVNFCVEGPSTDEVNCRGQYRVRLDGQWIEVPDQALVTERNVYGAAVVWPYTDSEGATQIRCFLPGAQG